MPERGFWIFLHFFLEFSCPGRVWTEFGTKFFFFVSLGLSHPVSAKNIAGKRFFNLLNFSLFFSEFSCPGRAWTEFGNKFFFFLSFWAFLIPFRLKILPERGFFNFLNFLLFFWNFLARFEYERNSRIKFFSLFFSLSHPVLAKNYAGKMFF